MLIKPIKSTFIGDHVSWSLAGFDHVIGGHYLSG